MSFITVAAGQPIRSTHVNQFSQWVTGSRTDISATLNSTSAAGYTLAVTNQDTSAGFMAAFAYGSTTVITFNKTGATFSVPLVSTSPLQIALAASQTAGDVFMASSATTFMRIAKGTAFQSFVMNGGATSGTFASCAVALAQTTGDLIGATAANTLVRIPRSTTPFMSLVMNAPGTGQTYAACAVSAATTQGDLFYATAANSVVRLARGNNGDVLSLATGVPVWTAPTTAVALLITSTTLLATASTIEFTSISQSFRHLEIYVSSFNATGGSNLSLQFSATGTTFDTSAAYDVVYSLAGNTSASGAVVSGGTSGFIAGHGGAASNTLSPAKLTVLDYTNTSFQKSYVSQGTRKDGTAVTEMFQYTLSGFWRSSTAVQGVRLLTAGNFGIGSRVSIYGVPAA